MQPKFAPLGYDVICTCKYQGKRVPISLDTARYRMFVDLQSKLEGHNGKAMWKDIHMGVAPKIQIAGATRLQIIATLPHVHVQMTEHGAEVRYV